MTKFHSDNLPAEAREYAALVEAATPGPWKFEPGGGHAYNRINVSESVQISGWPERINGYSNASYSGRICENLGDIDLPAPKANVRLIVNAPTAIRRLCEMLSEARDALLLVKTDPKMELDSTTYDAVCRVLGEAK